MNNLTRISPTSRPLPVALEPSLSDLEEALGILQSALQGDDPSALDLAARELQGALGRAVDHFRRAALCGPIEPALRQRLRSASVRITVQREALARATASLDRAIDVLLPGTAATYGASGTAQRLGAGGVLSA